MMLRVWRQHVEVWGSISTLPHLMPWVWGQYLFCSYEYISLQQTMLWDSVMMPPQKMCSLNVTKSPSLFFHFRPLIVARCPDHSEMKAICALQYRARSGESEVASGFCLTTPSATAITALGKVKGVDLRVITLSEGWCNRYLALWHKSEVVTECNHTFPIASATGSHKMTVSRFGEYPP